MAEGEGLTLFYATISHLPGAQVGGLVEGEDEEGVDDVDGMKEGLGRETVELSFPA